jgi:hypothetical protein
VLRRSFRVGVRVCHDSSGESVEWKEGLQSMLWTCSRNIAFFLVGKEFMAWDDG